MQEIELDDVNVSFFQVIDDAVLGRPTFITRHGQRQAVVLGYDEWQRLSRVPSFGRLLMSAPVDAADLTRRKVE